MDTLLTTADRALRTVFAQHHASRANPANGVADASLSDSDKREAAALMALKEFGVVQVFSENAGSIFAEFQQKSI